MRISWQLKFALLLIALIIIPSFFLAYFSIRAIEAERLAYEQRIRESYQRLAQYAISELTDMVEDLEQSWVDNLAPDKLISKTPEEQHLILESFIRSNVLVEAAYLVTGTGVITYPPNRQPQNTSAFSTDNDPLTELDKWIAQFRQLSEKAENMEFRRNKPDSALAIFEQIVENFPVPRLKAIALNEIARIHIYRVQWQKAYDTYRKIIDEYPDARDLNNLHLRFYAKYQCVNALENLGELNAAMSELLELYDDLLEHSDEINRVQYEFFVERIQRTFQKIVVGFDEPQQAVYRAAYSELQEEKKKNIGTNYLVDKLYQRLSKGILSRDTYRDRFKFFSDFAVEQPYLVAYILLAENENFVVKAVLGLEIQLDTLKQHIFPEIISQGNFPDDVVIAILDSQQNFILGDVEKIISQPAIIQPLRDPLDFWQLAVFPTLENPLLSGGDQQLYSKLWGIFLLWLAIIIGAGLILYNLRKQHRLSLQKTTFVSSITHELKTPLTSIKMFVDFLARNQRLKDDAEAQQHLRIIHSESDRLNQLVDNVLDFAKMEQSTKKYVFEYEEPQAIVRRVVDTFRYQSEVHGVPIEVAIDENMPEIYADRSAISQALINLLSNAIKFSPNKQPVRVQASTNGKFVNISIIDRGIGIKKKHLKRIFDDYYRVNDQQALNIAGTGLGLPLVKRIIKAHRGEITVDSIYGEGTTFTVKLPVGEG